MRQPSMPFLFHRASIQSRLDFESEKMLPVCCIVALLIFVLPYGVVSTNGVAFQFKTKGFLNVDEVSAKISQKIGFS